MQRYTVGWAETMDQLAVCFERWRVVDWMTRPVRPGRRTAGLTPDERRVMVEWTNKDGKSVRLHCHRWDTPAENLRALFYVVDGMRLTEVRGVHDMMSSAYAQLREAVERLPHEVLGVAEDATLDVAKAAYRRLAGIHHPDKGGDPTRFREIQSAWDAMRGKENGDA